VLHVRLIVPTPRTDDVLGLLDDDPTVTNLVLLTDASRRPAGHLVLFDVARESASRLLEQLRDLGLERDGSISLDEAEFVLSESAERAEAIAPGRPEDAVVWDEIDAQAARDSALSWSFTAFLVLATLIAGIGRYLDQPILIVAAMVVGPEFAAVAAICVGLAAAKVRLAATAATTLVAGFALAIAIATVWWWIADLAGWIAKGPAGTGPQTDFIVDPDVWSFVVALLAGIAGVLSLTAAKSSTLVGVFISVVTVPAAGALGLTLATGLWDEASRALLQLAVNLAGMVLAGTSTLLVQRFVWAHVRRTFGTRVTDSRR
jgi:uncharacterized hydrophobic protein (TIGR00271 family)